MSSFLGIWNRVSKSTFYKRFVLSIWFFPSLLLVPLIILTVFGISGSSVGSYSPFFYLDKKDPNLLLNQPRSIRSDEWLVNTQLAVAQEQEGFPRFNKNIGESQDMSLTDAPYKEWSTLFKPQNLVFFIMPFENAFALKWWLMGYLLIISCYFFVLTILPKRKLLAIMLSVSLFFSAFVQWWYAYGTLGPLYYSLFIATAIIYLFRQKNLRAKLALGALAGYLGACFALILYPPFQVACGFVLVALIIGFFLNDYKKWGKQQRLQNILIVIGSGVISIVIAGLFILTRQDAVKAISGTVYPGNRSSDSGGFYLRHFMSPHLGRQFLTEKQTAEYLIDGKDRSNQSEASNFLLLTPFLFLPSIVLLLNGRKQKKPTDWPLLLINALFLVYLAHLFVHAFTPIARLSQLDQVAGGRLLIGMGLLNIFAIVLFIRNLTASKFSFSQLRAGIYCVLILALELYLSIYAHDNFGLFVRLKLAIAYSLPIPIVIYLLLLKRFRLAILGFLAFSVFIGCNVNPLYKGLTILTESNLSTAIREIGANNDEKWVSQGGYLENFASINGEDSLSGVYAYPQFKVWDSLPDADPYYYNRYAHVGFNIVDDSKSQASIKLITADSFVVTTDTCSTFLKDSDVGFIVTATVLKGACVKLLRTISYPTATYYIYDVSSI